MCCPKYYDITKISSLVRETWPKIVWWSENSSSYNDVIIFVQVAKQWFDYDRSTYKFIREVKEGGSVKFTNTSDFDENGIIYWIGTNGRYVDLNRRLV